MNLVFSTVFLILKCYPVFAFPWQILHDLQREDNMMDKEAGLSRIKDEDLSFANNIGYINNEEYKKIRQDSMFINTIISSYQPVGK